MWRKLTEPRRVLVPVDLTDDSLCAVETAVACSREPKAQIYLIHVISPGEESGKKAVAMENFFLRKVKHQANVACIVRTGTPAREILRFAREENIDLVVLPVGTASHGGTRDAGGVADIVIRNATVPVVVVKPDSAVRQLAAQARPGMARAERDPGRMTEGVHMMKYDEKYLQEIRQRVCSKCIDRTASGLCTASTFDACAINRFLPEIIDIVLAEPVDDYATYVARLRSRVCSACERQSPDGRCDLRDDVECALDRYFPMVIEAIRDAAGKSDNGARA